MIFTLAALAQDLTPAPFDTERFKPMADTTGYVVTQSASTLGHLQVGVGLWGNYSRDSVVLERNGRRVVGPAPTFPDALVELRSVADLQLGLGLFGRISLVADLPIILWQEGFQPGAPGTFQAPRDLANSSGPGDVQLHPKIVLLQLREGVPLGIAVGGSVTLPTGSTQSFYGEGSVTGSPMLMLETADGAIEDRDYHVRFAVNAGARFKPPDSFRGTVLGNEFLYRAALGLHPTSPVEFGVEAIGSVGGAMATQHPVEVLPHLKLLPTDNTSLVAGAGFGLTRGIGSPEVRLFVGATLAPRFDPLSLDRDKDGIPNKYDACISIPEDKDGFEDADGCPDEDNDRDGLLDPVDDCPMDPEDVDGFEDTDGCPDEDNDQDDVLDINDRCPMVPEDKDGFQDLDGCPDPDNDQDGFLDPVDRCPNAAETVNGFADDDGCPDERPFVDTDGDGYTDDVDGCPFDAEDFDGYEDDNGCPEPDNDLDGIFDIRDDCPFVPETRNGYLDDDGCPDEPPSRVVLERTRINILEKVFFDTAKATIQNQSFDLLDEVATVIIDHPAIGRIRVEGHTDSDGSDSYNERLSQRRAEAVRDHLIGKGVEPGRLEAVGFGESRPIESNDTSEGKSKNRRVGFVILDAEANRPAPGG